MNKSFSLRSMLESPRLEFLMEAHSGISAKIVEMVGFKGIWAGSFALSAVLGIKDTGDQDVSCMLNMLKAIRKATTIPILFDASTGYGGAYEIGKLAVNLEEMGVDGMCIEDKKLPKRNSLLKNVRHNLAGVSDFCNKIKAVKNAAEDSNFVLIARTEAFIAGAEVKEALRRAHAYIDAGADGILVHSNRGDILDIESFMKRWDNVAPVVIIPTTYCPKNVALFEDLGVSLVIWANHMMRSSVYYMKQIAKEVYAGRSIFNVEGKMTSIEDIFKLQGEI